jgi:adenylate cyclase class 2
MALEVEVKFLHVDHEELRRRLAAASATFVDRHFERNLVLDQRDGSLGRAGTLLRLRTVRGRATLTLKQPPETGGPAGFKRCQELETAVGDGPAMLDILRRLGFDVAFAYEKQREVWRLHGCLACLDLLPFGRYLELESSSGRQEDIARCADLLGLPLDQGSAKNYHQLHQEYRLAAGLAPQASFVFPDAERDLLERQDAAGEPGTD